MMKRAPGRASAACRLRLVGWTSKLRPQSRLPTSRRLRSTIAARTSAMARLDIKVEDASRLAGQQSVAGLAEALAQAGGLAGGQQQGGGVEGGDVLLGLAAGAGQQDPQPVRILRGIAADGSVDRRAMQADVLGGQHQVLGPPAVEAD